MSVVCIAVLTAIGLHRSHALDVAAIVYTPNGKSACVIYDKDIFENNIESPAFCLKEYDGLRGGMWEQLRLRLFPEAGGLCIGGTLEGLTWSPDGTGVLLSIQYNSDTDDHYEFVSYMEETVHILDDRLVSGLLHDFMEYSEMYGVDVTYETEVDIECLMWYEDKMVFRFELLDIYGKPYSGIFLITMESVLSFDEGRKTEAIALF